MVHLSHCAPTVVVALVLALAVGCYSHTGQPVDADDETWRQEARQACQRGDQAAFRALIARADDDPQLRCDGSTVVDATSSDSRK